MDDLIKAIEEKDAEIASKLRTALAADADSRKGADSVAAKALKTAQSELAKLKSDLEAASKGTDERVAQALKERDEHKTAAEQRTAELASTRLRHAVEKKLGISDEVKSRRAVGAFLEHAGDAVSLDEKGLVVGADKAIEAFKAAESFWFAPDAPSEPAAPTSPRAGSGAAPARPAGGKTNAPQTQREKIDAHKARMSGAGKKKGI